MNVEMITAVTSAIDDEPFDEDGYFDLAAPQWAEQQRRTTAYRLVRWCTQHSAPYLDDEEQGQPWWQGDGTDRCSWLVAVGCYGGSERVRGLAPCLWHETGALVPVGITWGTVRLHEAGK